MKSDVRFVTKLCNSHPLEVFEWEHPEPLRWDLAYKKSVYESPNSRFIWLKVKRETVGEIILTWESSNVVRVDSFTVLPLYRGKGYGTLLVEEAMRWARHKGFQLMVGEARSGASWKVFKALGAKKVLDYYNWGGSGESYILFKTKL